MAFYVDTNSKFIIEIIKILSLISKKKPADLHRQRRPRIYKNTCHFDICSLKHPTDTLEFMCVECNKADVKSEHTVKYSVPYTRI